MEASSSAWALTANWPIRCRPIGPQPCRCAFFNDSTAEYAQTYTNIRYNRYDAFAQKHVVVLLNVSDAMYVWRASVK